MLFIGDNANVATVVGVNVARERVKLFTLMGTLAGFAAVLLTLENRNFFNTQAKRDVMQLAANIIGANLNSTLLAIQPSGQNTWTGNVRNPTTGQPQSFANQTIPANTIILYVGARALPGAVVPEEKVVVQAAVAALLMAVVAVRQVIFAWLCILP